MEFNEFADSFQEALRAGDTQLANQLEKIAKEKNDPYFFHYLASMFEPIPQDFIDEAIGKRENIQFKMLTECVPCSVLDNRGNQQSVKDFVTSEYYYKLAFGGIKKLAEVGDTDAMSTLGNMYWNGVGCCIRPDKKKAKYWLDKCYLLVTGETHDEWIKNNI